MEQGFSNEHSLFVDNDFHARRGVRIRQYEIVDGHMGLLIPNLQCTPKLAPAQRVNGPAGEHTFTTFHLAKKT